MKRLSLLLIIVCLLYSAPASADDFNCWIPPFGAPLGQLNANNEFEKYMEKEGVSYYRYYGQCDMKLAERTIPSLAYGFVDGKLYARFIWFKSPEKIGHISMRTLFINDSVSMKTLKRPDGTMPDISTKKYEEGDWSILKIVNNDSNRIVKIKYNKKTNVIKSAMYYRPLHSKLQAVKAGAAEPEAFPN